MVIETFETDIDKITDLMQFVLDTKETGIMQGIADFQKSYSYLTTEEVVNTVNKITGIETVEELASIYRQAENLHIENMNGRNTGYNVTGEQAKETTNNFAKLVLTEEQYQEFLSTLQAMGC